MNGVYKHYVIDLSCNNNFVQVPAVQGDGNNVRGFEVELISNNVQYVVDAENTIVSIAGTKPDTKQILNSCEVTEEGYILVDITSQMTAVAGRGDYSITLMDKNTNALLQSFPFYILITKSAFNANEIVSSNEFQLLTEKIVTVERLDKELTENENVRNTNENIRIENENVRIDNENQRINAENVREANEETRIENEQKRQENEESRQETFNTSLENVSQAIKDAEDATLDAIDATGKANKATEDAEKAIKEVVDANTSANKLIDELEEFQTSASENEEERQNNEEERQKNETKRNEDAATALNNMNDATNNTVSATNKANAISKDLEDKLASGYFNGKDGVIMKLEQDECAFSIVDDCLILTYDDGT